MKKSIMHIASFAGNIGDLINHEGFYKSFGMDERQIEKIEIRRFYRNCTGPDKLWFDSRLIERINQKQLLVLGGGGFFDVYWDESATGTTFDITRKFIDQIKIPVLVNAMGVHFVHGKRKAQDRFYHFFSYIMQRENWYVSIRNDGSAARLKRVYGNEFLGGVHSVPDNGFLAFAGSKTQPFDYDKRRIGFSITNELFDPSYINDETADGFNAGMTQLIEELLCNDKETVFFMHGPQDVFTLHKILKPLGPEIMRNNLIISPYDAFSGEGSKILLKYYNGCDAVIGMRFHSNAIAVSQNIPVIGLAIHEQISGLYDEIGYQKQCLKIGTAGYWESLKMKMKEMLADKRTYVEEEKNIMQNIIISHHRYVSSANDFFKLHGIFISGATELNPDVSI